MAAHQTEEIEGAIMYVELRLTVDCLLLGTKVAYPDVQKFFKPESPLCDVCFHKLACNPESDMTYCARLAREGYSPSDLFGIDFFKPSCSPEDPDCKRCRRCFPESSQA